MTIVFKRKDSSLIAKLPLYVTALGHLTRMLSSKFSDNELLQGHDINTFHLDSIDYSYKRTIGEIIVIEENILTSISTKKSIKEYLKQIKIS